MFIHTKPRYNINDLLSLLSIGRSRLYAAIAAGELETYKIGKRRFTSPAALDAYVATKEMEAQQ
jgi:excisionase family DNA binding protein